MDIQTLVFVVAVICFFVAIPFIVDAIRKKDFKDQVSGKKKIHKLPESYKINSDQHSLDPMVEQVTQRGIDQIKTDTKSIHL